MSGAERAYLSVVERFFVVLRRSGLMLSAVDVDRVEAWRQAGLSAEDVCRGLANGAERYRQRQGADAKLPSTLAYYEAFVDEVKAARRVEPPASVAETARSLTSDVEAALAELAWIGKAETDPRRKVAYRAAWRALSIADVAEEAPAAADAAAVDALLGALAEHERAGLLAEVETALEPEKTTLGRRGLIVRRRAVLEDLVAARYGLVRLSDGGAR